jgi:hypothetical protein
VIRRCSILGGKYPKFAFQLNYYSKSGMELLRDLGVNENCINRLMNPWNQRSQLEQFLKEQHKYSYFQNRGKGVKKKEWRWYHLL